MRAGGVFVLWAMAAVALPAQTFTTIHSFDLTDGDEPQGALVQGTDGNFYGVTFGGGSTGNGPRTVILVHGWTCDETTWASQIPALAVMAVDVDRSDLHGRIPKVV